MALLLSCYWLEALPLLCPFKHQNLMTCPDFPDELEEGGTGIWFPRLRAGCFYSEPPCDPVGTVAPSLPQGCLLCVSFPYCSRVSPEPAGRGHKLPRRQGLLCTSRLLLSIELPRGHQLLADSAPFPTATLSFTSRLQELH